MTSYYDFGPYYGRSKVLGIGFSSLEKLPVPEIPQGATLQPATGNLPGSIFYPFSRFTENVQLTFTFDTLEKEKFRLELATRRLSEAKALADQGKPDLAAQAASDYADTIRSVAENLSALASQNPEGAKELTARVEETAAAQSVAASNLLMSSPASVSDGWREVSDATKNLLDKAAEVSGQPPIPEELSEGIQQLKDQGLITPEETNKLYGLKTRSEVREEIDKLTASGQFPVSETLKLDTAIAAKYPETYKQTGEVLRFAELRSYETFTPPTDKVLEDIAKWEARTDADLPPPAEIRPYLYYSRAQELAKDIDMTNFDDNHQAELAKSYPQAVQDNPTYSPAPSPSPTPTPSPEAEGSPSPKLEGTATPEEGAGSSPSPSPKASPSVAITAVTAEPYIGKPSGALPGDTFYFWKQWGEGVQLATTFDSAKRIELNMRFAEERLREANALSGDKDKAALYEQTLERYGKQIKSVSTSLDSFSGPDATSEDLARKLESQAARHEAVFETGLLPATQKSAAVIGDVIMTAQDVMDWSADALGRPALPPALTDRLQDLKAQGQILSEEVDALTNAKSREEVRDKIRELADLGTFPPADAKKLDEAQNFTFPKDYNQLVEVRKVEELQQLRAVQTEFAQTATLRATNAQSEQRANLLSRTIDPDLIKPEDLAGQDDLLKKYQDIVSTASTRPINGGQFIISQESTPSASPSPAIGGRADAVLTTCPAGAVFKQFEGCVWEDNGKKIDDYEQYRCGRPGEYWSFAAKRCVPMDLDDPEKEDGRPSCPVGYVWSWNLNSCETFTGGGLPFPTPRPTASPASDEEIAERSKSCPEGSTYKVPQGCVWDKTGQPIYSGRQYTCPKGRYYSFEQFSCVPAPKDDAMGDDAYPGCKDPATRWSWKEGKCMALPEPTPQLEDEGSVAPLTTPRVYFAAPDSPFYAFKRAGEAIRYGISFTERARQEARLAQANERLAESLYLLEKKDEEGFKETLGEYTKALQDTYRALEEGKERFGDADKTALSKKLADISSQNYLLQKASVITGNDSTAAINSALSAVTQAVDRAADLKGDPPIPDDVKAKIEALPTEMIKEEDKKAILEADSRVEARVKVSDLATKGLLDKDDTSFLDEGVAAVDPGAVVKLNEIKKLDEIVTLTKQTEDLKERVEKAEDIAQKLDEFKKTFEPGNDIPAEVRPYVRLTRIDEVVRTIRPDIIKLEDFNNRKDVQLAIATLREEFKPTKESIRQLEDFRRSNPGKPLPYELARIEALSFGLGIRQEAGPCFLPTPPFAPNTPCPPPGASIQVTSYYGGGEGQDPRLRFFSPFNPVDRSTFGVAVGAPGGVDKDGKPLVYGKGPEAVSAGVCPSGYHWMYDSGGWCMSDSGSYAGSYPGSPGPGGYSGYGGGGYGGYGGGGYSTPGYTPYSPYYSPQGYSVGDVSPNDGCPYGSDRGGNGECVPNSYPASGYTYSPPSYYGVATTSYTTYPPSGTVPGTGPKPTAPGQCPSGFHWMSDSGGWCMADGPTYVPSGSSYYPGSATTSGTPPPGGYNCGSQPFDPATGKCKDGACPGGFNWDGSKCVASSSSYYSPNLNQSSCGPGYYWDGRGCIPTYSGGYYGSGSYYSGYNSSTGSCTPPSGGCGAASYWDSPTCSCRPSYGSGSTSCTPPPAGCGSNYYWDSGVCSCRSSYGGGGYSSGSGCQPPSSGCGTSSYWDYGSCSCRSSSSYYGGSGPSPSNSCQGISCGGGSYLDYSTCSCRPSSSSTGSYSGSCTPPSSGCGTGGWYDYGSCSCRTSSSTSTSTGGGSTTTSGSCPSGYHWMSDNGGWCMSDGAQSSTSTSTSTSSTPTSTPPPSTQTSSPPPSPSSETSSPPPSSSQPPPPSTTSTPPAPPPSP